MAALAELLGAGGVIISLLYLAAQVRQSSRESRVAAGETAIRAFREILMPINTNAELVSLYSRMFLDPDTFDGPDGPQAFHVMFQVMKAAESIHFHHINGMLDDGTWKGWSRTLVHYINTPGFQHYWGVRQDVYSPAFQAWVRESAVHTAGRVIGRMEGLVGGDTA